MRVCVCVCFSFQELDFAFEDHLEGILQALFTRDETHQNFPTLHFCCVCVFVFYVRLYKYIDP